MDTADQGRRSSAEVLPEGDLEDPLISDAEYPLLTTGGEPLRVHQVERERELDRLARRPALAQGLLTQILQLLLLEPLEHPLGLLGRHLARTGLLLLFLLRLVGSASSHSKPA